MGQLKNRSMDEPDCETFGSMIGKSEAMRNVFELTLRMPSLSILRGIIRLTSQPALTSA